MKKIRVGVIGAGNIGKVHIDALRNLPNVEVVSICSRTNMEERAKALNISSFYTDYKEMIDQENLDSVHICTTNDTHYEMAAYAIKNNLHVVLEKPMTKTLEEAKNLYDLVKDTNLVHEVHFHNRFYPTNQALKKNIEKAGKLNLIYGNYLQDWMTPKDQFNWRATKEASGVTRVIHDVGTHFFDLIEYVSGHKVVEVFAELKTIYDERNGILIDTEDIGVVIFKTDKGALGNVLISQSVPGIKNELKTVYVGENATLSWDGKSVNESQILYYDKDTEIIKTSGIMTLKNGIMYDVDGFFGSFKETLRSVYHKIENREFKQEFADFSDGLHSMMIVEAIYQSHIKKVWVKLNEL